MRSGDSIIINPSKRHVAISGGVNTPAIYELKDNETLDDLVNLAQGLSVSATDEISIYNSTGSTQQVAPEEMDLIELNHGDSVKIPLFSPITKKILTVTIEGAVKKYTDKIGYVPQKISIDWTLPIRVVDFMFLTKDLDNEQINVALNLSKISSMTGLLSA